MSQNPGTVGTLNRWFMPVYSPRYGSNRFWPIPIYIYVYLYCSYTFPPDNKIYSVDQCIICTGIGICNIYIYYTHTYTTVHVYIYMIIYGIASLTRWWTLETGPGSCGFAFARQNRPSKLPGPEVQVVNMPDWPIWNKRWAIKWHKNMWILFKHKWTRLPMELCRVWDRHELEMPTCYAVLWDIRTHYINIHEGIIMYCFCSSAPPPTTLPVMAKVQCTFVLYIQFAISYFVLDMNIIQLLFWWAHQPKLWMLNTRISRGKRKARILFFVTQRQTHWDLQWLALNCHKLPACDNACLLPVWHIPMRQ